MRTRSATVLAALVTALLLAACADDSADPGSTGSPATETPASPGTPSPGPSGPVPTLPPTVSPPAQPPTKPSPGQAMTLTGEVISGVEPGCRLLQTDSGEYLLFGEPAEELRAGTTVTVRGEARPDMASTCQQGTPFEVAEVVD